MEPRLRDYVENLFATAPRTKQAYELKEEIIRNTIERYHDLIADGKSEGEAYNLAIAGIGDINELLEALGAEPVSEQKYTDEQLAAINSRSSIFKGIAVALYILCVTPNIFLSMTPLINIAPAFMFFMVSIATGLLIYGKRTKYTPVMDNHDEVVKIKRKAIIKATAIGMYISCVTPCILLAQTSLVNISPVFMFLLIAGATVMVVVSKNRNTYEKTDETMVENFKEWNSRKKSTSALYKILVAILWVTTSFVYIFITTVSGFFGVAVTWIIFLVAAALQNLMRAVFDYVEAKK